MATTEERGIRILVADDDLTSRTIMDGFVRKLGYETQSVSNGTDAWDVLAADNPPCMALLDWEMPGMDGMEVVRRARAEFGSRPLYIIMVTSKDTQSEIVEGLGDGADDYVAKPFDPAELDVRIRSGARILKLQKQLLDANQRLEELARTDMLTGFYNRLALNRDLKKRFEEVDYGPPVSFIMVDLDHFKMVNDTYGHDGGDRVLRQFADRVKLQLRHCDVVCRMGGEEFLVIALDADRKIGMMLAERLRRTVEKDHFVLADETHISVTCSLGIRSVASVRKSDDMDTFINDADLALYQSKDTGRNKTTAFEDL
jgi:two-component system, cell cycle response regulator